MPGRRPSSAGPGDRSAAPTAEATAWPGPGAGARTSFLSTSGSDNGCLPFRAVAALHTSYPGGQPDGALAFLRSHRNTRLVTVMLGANDLFLCQASTSDGCTSPNEAAAAVQTVATNLTKALVALRAVYVGRLEVVSYDSTDYTDASVTGPGTLLNQALASLASPSVPDCWPTR